MAFQEAGNPDLIRGVSGTSDTWLYRSGCVEGIAYFIVLPIHCIRAPALVD